MPKNKSKIWIKQIKKIAKYSKNLGYEIVYKKANHGISTICFSKKEITIHESINKERQFYTILHELGHLIINKQMKKKYSKNYDYQYQKFSKKSMVYKITEIEEEIEAWRLGYELAKKLKLKINRSNFEIYKSSLLSTYLVSAVRTKILGENL